MNSTTALTGQARSGARGPDSTDGSMVVGMANMQKVTVTLPTSAVLAIRELVAAGKADSVSGFVQHAVQICLDDVAEWGAMLAEALAQTGGDLTEAEVQWASSVLGLPAGATDTSAVA